MKGPDRLAILHQRALTSCLELCMIRPRIGQMKRAQRNQSLANDGVMMTSLQDDSRPEVILDEAANVRRALIAEVVHHLAVFLAARHTKGNGIRRRL